MIRRFPFHRLDVALVAAVMSVAGCKTAADTAATAKPSVAAQTVTVARQPFTETLGAIGSVSARSGHAAALSAPAPSHIAKVLVTTGQTVAAGQVVIELDQAPFVATAQSAEAALNAAERAYERQQRLADSGIVPRREAESAAADVARARAEAAAARRAAELSMLHSPINGVVTRLTASLGASVDPSQVLIEIADPTALDVLFSVTPTDAGRIHPGARVTLSAGQDAAGRLRRRNRRLADAQRRRPRSGADHSPSNPDRRDRVWPDRRPIQAGRHRRTDRGARARGTGLQGLRRRRRRHGA
jgi:multidrug efflux pump subunit AcrA (membrane-fusion protein)